MQLTDGVGEIMSNFSELYGPDLSNTQSRITVPQMVKPGTNR
jgi:hypothetical protein